MKTISKRFLKASVAMLLVVMMLFSSTISGFAAVVDNAETGAQYNLNWKGKVYFLAPDTWDIDTYKYIQVDITRTTSASSSNYQYYAGTMTRVGDSRLFFLKLDADHSSWGQNEYIAFTANSSTYGAGTFTLNTNHYYTTPLDYGCNNSSNYYFFKPSSTTQNSSTSNGNTMTGSYSSSRSLIEAAQTVNITCDDVASSACGTVKMTGYYDTSDTAVAQSSSTSSGSSVSYSGAIQGTDMKLEATPKTGYKFVGWYSGSTLLSSNTSYTYNVFNAKTITAKFETNGYSYTVSAGEGGTITSATSGTATSATITAKANEGYTFEKWTVTGGSVANATSASTTFTITANNATAVASFKKLSYTVTFKDWDGSQIGDTQTIEYGGTATVPADPERANYVFQGWSSNGTTVTGVASPVTANATYTAIYKINQYTVTFVDHDGTVIDTVTVDHGSDATPPADPTRTGYDFAGWEGSYKNVTENTTVTATYTIKTYTISVVVSPDGGGEATVNDASSATVEHGQEITLKAVPSDGYRFHAWVINGRDVASTAEFKVAPEGDATYTATFKKIWDVTVVVPEGVTSVGYQGGNPSSTTTYEDITEGWSSPFTATVSTGYELVGWEVKKVDADGKETIETFDTATINVTVDANTTITPVVKKLYNVAVVSGATASDGTGYHAAGKEVTVKFVAPGGKYLESVSIALTDEKVDIPNVTVNKDENSATFVMPESDLTLTPNYGDLLKVSFSENVFSSTTLKADGYYPGQDVTIQVTPKGGYLITGITSEQTEVTYDKTKKEITFVMPATDVTLDVAYQASFHAYSDVITVHIDNPAHSYTPEDGGTVKMTCNGVTLTEGGDVDGDVTYTATPKTDYDFVGFYSDYDCNKFLSAETTYTVSPESDITVYALFARKQYIRISGNSFRQMAFDRTQKAYTMVYTLDGEDTVGTAPIGQNLFNDGFDFDVHYNKNATDHAYHGWGDADFTVDLNNNSYARSVSWGSSRWHVGSAQDNTSFPLTITIKPESVHVYNKIDVSARAVKEGATIYLSSGWKDMPKSLKPTSEFTSTVNGATTTNLQHNVSNTYYDTESYTKATITTAQTVSFKTTLSGDDAANYYVDSFVVYDIFDKTYTIVTPNSAGSNVYEGTVYVDNDCYIVPIFFHTDAYIASQEGYKTIELYFDATSIQGTSWGPFVSAYAYGDDWYTGVWTGQMMIPTEDGSSWYTEISVPEDGLSGIVFNNYLYDTCPSTNAGVFGVTGTNLQTYDYREALTLYELDYEVITFVAKTSKDGYHGDDRNHSSNSKTEHYVDGNTNALNGKYVFDYLYARDGVTPMDLNAEPIENVAKSYDENGSVNNADYYIISSGDVDYNSGDYTEDDGYNGNWSVEWYVFDKTGKYITKVLSDGFYNADDKDSDTYLIKQLKSKGYTDIEQAVVAISYEAPNQGAGDTQLSYDGQWYGNMLDDTVKGSVIVGLDDGNGNFTLEEDDSLNEGIYGEGYLKDLEGGLHQSLDIKMDYGIADLTASSKTGYRFIGWYTKKADGTYAQISNAPTYSTYINMDSTYYAIFRALGETEIVVNHRIYNNDDQAIPSHGGVGELSVKILDSNRNEITKSTISTSSSTATFTAEERETYIIQIYTTPLMNGEFFAWYTDSYKADGTKTYEEILTEEEHVGSKTMVWNEFEYTYDSTDPDLLKVINIYSDIRRVSNYATLKYQYRNRFGQVRTYTVKDILLTDEECTGIDSDGKTFSGNDGRKYCPAYRTLLTFKTPQGEDFSFYCPQENVADRISDYENQKYTFIDSYNKVATYAPNAEVTEVYGQNVTWNVTDVNLTPATSEITLVADQDDCKYYLSYQIGDDADTIPGYFNDLVQVEAPRELNGMKFSYWVEIKDGEEVILTYLQNYRYRLTEDKFIKAVYQGAIDDEVWTPSINSVTYTREFADGGDYIYTDYLLAFNNNKALELNDVKVDENGNQKYKYGLLLVRDADYYYEPIKKIEIEFPDAQNAEMKQNLEAVALKGASEAFTTSDGNVYNCYCYDLSASALTNLNRCNYFRKYDNDKVVGGSHYYREYAFTAVAYLIDVENNKIYLSDPEGVNFYELATTDTDNIE